MRRTRRRSSSSTTCGVDRVRRRVVARPVVGFCNVAGLLGAGLLLSLNDGQEVVPVEADGSYAFVTLLDAGQPYSVTVLAQPTTPDQVCSIANGSGSIGAADVTNVDVTCAAAAFHVGGSVTGLLGSGLQLQVNGGETLDIAADGSFVFATDFADDDGYDVTVLTQPGTPNQVCTVANAAGTIVGSDVSDVAVTCATTNYSIGGSVSGLVGSGLVLAIDGGETLSIAADGAFVFPTPRADGSAFAVVVQSQPRAPVQRCTVTDGSGTLSGADADAVAIQCLTLPLPIFGDGLEDPAP